MLKLLEVYRWAFFLWIQKPFVCPYFSGSVGFKTLLPYPLHTSSSFGFHDFSLSPALFPSFFYTLSIPFLSPFPLPSPPLSSPEGWLSFRFNLQLSFLHLYPPFQSKFVLGHNLKCILSVLQSCISSGL